VKRRRLDTYTGETRDEKAKRAVADSMRRREQAYADLLTEDGWRAFVHARALHRYSWRNCALIASQRPGAVAVATYSQWKAVGYVVREGEHSTVKITTRAGGRFSSASLFDVTQTDCPPPDDPSELYPDGYTTIVERLYAAVSRPRTLDDIPRAGEGIQLAYERLTRAQERSAA
jgi:hypothetical protein